MKEVAREDFDFPVGENDFSANRYYEASGKKVRLFVHLQFIDGRDFVQMHLYVVGNNREAVCVMRETMPDFMKMLRDVGMKSIVAIRPATDDIHKWVRFLLLGMGKDFKIADFRWKGSDYKVISVEVDDGA